MEELEINEYMQAMMRSMLDIDYYNHELEADNSASAYQDAVENGGVAYEAIDNGFKVTFTFTDLNLSIPLQVVLEGDHVNAKVDTKAIEYDPTKLSLLQVHILPYFGAVSYTNKKGYALIPDGCGALIYATNNKENAPAYQKPVFGKDITIDATDYEGVTLPCFGVSAGKDSLLAVIGEDSADAYINCENYGQATMYTHPWASFKTTVDFEYALVSDYYSTRVFEQGGIKADTLSVDYYPISGKQSGYVEMASKYRELIFSAEQRKAAKVEAALYLDLYASVTKVRSILGFKGNYDDVITSTEDVEKLIKKLAELDVDSTVVRYSAWNKQENTGHAVDDIKWNKAIGDVAELVEKLAAQGSKVYPAVNRVMTYDKSSNILHTMSGVTRDPASRMIMFPDRYLTTSKTGESYILNYDKLAGNLSALLDNADGKMTNLGLSDVANMLYSDFSEGDKKRPAFVSMITEKLAAFAEENSLLLDAPNSYAAVYADEIINLPTSSTGNMMLDEDVPFLQLVYSGVIRYSTEALNMQGSPKASFLKGLEYGSMPCYSWIGDEGSALINTELDYLYSADSDFWMDTATEQYAVVRELVEKTEGSVIVGHEQLADGVYATTYENGVRVLVNYNDTAYKADGVTVSAMGYVIGG